MQADSLQTPKTGRSRFSKALPRPPDLDPQLPSKQLPSLPQLPSKETLMSDKPLPSPLMLSLPRTSSLRPVPPVKSPNPTIMSIPRRPVAPSKDMTTTVQGQPEGQFQPQPQLQQKAEEAPKHSPNGSISSLLSAYSRSSGESLIRSSNGGSSQRGSEPTLSPVQGMVTGERNGLFTPATATSYKGEKDDGSQGRLGSRYDSGEKRLPNAPAFTAGQAVAAPARKPEPGAASMANPINLANTSPPRPQIWRRRSITSEKSVDIFDLKLTVSHGSTAASQSAITSAISPIPSSNLSSPATKRLQPPRSGGGLPGRNIRPVPSKEAIGEQGAMGQKATTLTDKLHGLRPDAERPRLASQSDSAIAPPPQRLPTPDYEKEDVQTPILIMAVSPVSPASSPEPPKEVTTSETKQGIQRRAVGTHDLHAAKSLPDIKKQASVPFTSSEAPPAIAREFGSRPTDVAAATRGADAQAQSQFPPRTSSTKPKQPWQPADRVQRPGTSPATVQEMGSNPRDKGPEDVVEYREQRVEDLPPPDPRAAYFPLSRDAQPSPGMVVTALPLKASMHNCYTRHQKMDRSRNRNHPLTCQTCQRADSEDRFKCSWCYVRMCEPCLQIFNSQGRDLAKLVSHLESNPPSSTTSRPPSAGLETVQE